MLVLILDLLTVLPVFAALLEEGDTFKLIFFGVIFLFCLVLVIGGISIMAEDSPVGGCFVVLLGFALGLWAVDFFTDLIWEALRSM